MIEDEGVLYLEYEDALDLYATIFACSLQEAEDQLRNSSGLESFIEGNKRTAFFACEMFLGVNGYGLHAPQAEVAAWIEDLSAGLRPRNLMAEYAQCWWRHSPCRRVVGRSYATFIACEAHLINVEVPYGLAYP